VVRYAFRRVLLHAGITQNARRPCRIRDLDLPNRALGTVERITNGELTLRMDSGRTVTFDPHEMRHFDHGYAVTSNSAQGLTAERVLVNMDTEMHSNLMNARFAYVSISRGSHEAQIFTDNATELGERLSHEVSKTSATNITKEEKPKLGQTQNQCLSQQAEVGVRLSM
jgi:ATP-dependent exoDNAse (exonuclease V) alpha subunit